MMGKLFLIIESQLINIDDMEELENQQWMLKVLDESMIKAMD